MLSGGSETRSANCSAGRWMFFSLFRIVGSLGIVNGDEFTSSSCTRLRGVTCLISMSSLGSLNSSRCLWDGYFLHTSIKSVYVIHCQGILTTNSVPLQVVLPFKAKLALLAVKRAIDFVLPHRKYVFILYTVILTVLTQFPQVLAKWVLRPVSIKVSSTASNRTNQGTWSWNLAHNAWDERGRKPCTIKCEKDRRQR